DDMGGQLAGLELLDGSVLRWAEDDSGQWTTQLSLNANMGDLQRTFDDLSMEPLATTRSGDLSLDLGWPGGPTDIDLLQLSGTSRLTLREGSFLPV
ncbi:MAG: AsmA-like C-terminal region-containing protein, partial [Luminiphilus sp.]